MEPVRLAAIDVGTNTIKLLVAAFDGRQLTALHEDSRTTRLGERVAETQRLAPEAIERTVAGVGALAGRARDMGAAHVLAVATSGARESANAGEFVARVRETLGIEVEIITGEREAELIFAGVSTDPRWSGRRLLIMDVGGGSAELITGQQGRIEHRVSFPGGAVRLTERFLRGDPVGDEELTALMNHQRELIQSVLTPFAPGGRLMIGTGGTITTAAAVDQALTSFSIEKVDHYALSAQRLWQMLERLRRMPLAERQRVPGLPPKRADIIVAGLAMFVTAMRLAGIPEITVSTRGLRFGLLAEMCGLLK
ncbi:MAG: Ppx/GppA family phosphatase [Verrucomicrobiae bacterium]|nr:Ppx/GppA family phosphatase [Verrucomicrobiae bacterium]